MNFELTYFNAEGKSVDSHKNEWIQKGKTWLNEKLGSGSTASNGMDASKSLRSRFGNKKSSGSIRSSWNRNGSRSRKEMAVALYHTGADPQGNSTDRKNRKGYEEVCRTDYP